MDSSLNKTFEKLKYDLVREDLISYEDIENAQSIAQAQNINLGQALINSNLIDETRLLKFIESKLHIPYVNLDDYDLDIKCLDYISFNDVLKYKVIPLFKIENCLTIAMSDPLNLFIVDKFIEKTGLNIEPVLSAENSILKKIEKYYETNNTMGQIHIDESSKKINWQDNLSNQNLSDENIQILIKNIIEQALIENIHELFFEYTQNGLSVNFKQNHESRLVGTIPQLLTCSFIMRLKTLSNLDPQVSEIPQLGKFVFKVDEKQLIASISAFPTIHGERILLKIYNSPSQLENLPIVKHDILKIKNALKIPGVILTCGGPLSGKTHIIYSLLSSLKDEKKNIMTIESIAKYDLGNNINQCELNENIGFNLTKAMKFIEFQSPDIIYFEGINTQEALDYFNSLVYKNKTLLTEFLTDNVADLRKKLMLNEFTIFKSLISLIILIHSHDSIEVFDKENLKKFLYDNSLNWN